MTPRNSQSLERKSGPLSYIYCFRQLVLPNRDSQCSTLSQNGRIMYINKRYDFAEKAKAWLRTNCYREDFLFQWEATKKLRVSAEQVLWRRIFVNFLTLRIPTDTSVLNPVKLILTNQSKWRIYLYNGNATLIITCDIHYHSMTNVTMGCYQVPNYCVQWELGSSQPRRKPDTSFCNLILRVNHFQKLLST